MAGFITYWPKEYIKNLKKAWEAGGAYRGAFDYLMRETGQIHRQGLADSGCLSRKKLSLLTVCQNT